MEQLPMKQQKDELSMLLIHFIEQLKKNDFVVSIDHYINSYLLLLSVNIHQKEIDEIKYLICPIFANNSSQQRMFYEIFDQYFNVNKVSGEYNNEFINSISNSSSLKKNKNSSYFFAGGIFLIFIVSIIFLYNKNILYSFYSNFSLQNKYIIEKCSSDNNNKSELPGIQISIDIFAKSSVQILFRFMLISLSLIFIWYELYRLNKRNLFLTKSNENSHYVTINKNIEKVSDKAFKNRKYYNTLKRLKQRTDSDIYAFDINNSLLSTIENAGFPATKYRPVTKPSEYLFLIDLTEIDDHYSTFMNNIVDMLETDGVYTKTFFYSYDPRKCFYKMGDKPVSLFDIKSNYPNFNLILVGDCQSLINPINNQLHKWTELFYSWNHSAILTYRHPKDWSNNEILLSETFFLLPASIESFRFLADYFETNFDSQPINFDSIKSTLSPRYFEQMPADVKSLRRYFNDEKTFQWLCSCAVFPQINWSLTLFLSSFLEMQLTEEKLLMIIRLPWFRNGIMPDDLRSQLIGELQQKTLRNIRYAILNTLLSKPITQLSKSNILFAYSLFGFRKKSTSKIKEKLYHSIKKEDQPIRNLTFFRFIESFTITPITFKLSKIFYKHLRIHGLPLLSFFDIKSITTLFLSSIILFSVFFIFPYNTPTHNVTMDFSFISQGVYTMGSSQNEIGRSKNEKIHNISIENGFYIMKTEVSQKQWKAIMGNDPSHFKSTSGTYPVTNVSWDDVNEFIKKLNHILKTEKFSLPSESEWEYACRSGTKTSLSNGELANIGCDLDRNLNKIGWYCGNSKGTVQQIGKKNPNLWGIYDMHGNVSEWCNNSYTENEHLDLKKINLSKKTIRGGNWHSPAEFCRSAKRFFEEHDYRSKYVGFRLIIKNQ